MYAHLRPWIFRSQPEQAHHATIALLQLAGAIPPARWLIRRMFPVRNQGPQVTAFGITFPNPIGMAAGYDKDALAWRGLGCLGFGHIELGTVTPVAQPGNPTPRIFRLVEDDAAINRMGFPNRGADFIAQQLRGRRPPGLVLGMNIGKNKTTPNEEAVNDYLSLLRTFAPLVDYLAVNISSPNTPGLRALQSRAPLEALLIALADERIRLISELGKPIPILVKLSPDLTDAELEDAIGAVETAGMDGLILTNTTLQRAGLGSLKATETGGLSGAPLRSISTAMLKRARKLTNLPIVASGGVMTEADAQEKLDEGACLVQIYTGLIFRGPGFPADILNHGLHL